MFTKIRTYLNFAPSHRTLIIGLLVILAIAVTAGFAWMQMDNVIAPPGLRMLDWLWRGFI
jgi:hypothetical protein